jgi:hypothetical protein
MLFLIVKPDQFKIRGFVSDDYPEWAFTASVESFFLPIDHLPLNLRPFTSLGLINEA